MTISNRQFKKLIISGFFIALLFFVQTREAKADVLIPGPIDTCGEITVGGTYTLSQNIGSGGSCITFSSNGATLVGAGYTLTGNVVSSNGTSSSAGISISIQNITITGTVTAGSGSSDTSGGAGGSISATSSTITGAITAGNGGVGSSSTGGAGGSVTIATSTVGVVISGNGGEGLNANNVLAIGGAVTITGSSHGAITSGSGALGTPSHKSGAGGLIGISGSSLNFSDITITAGSGAGTKPSGTLTLTYTSITTNNSTFFYNVSGLIVNGVSRGAWNAVYNPLVGSTITNAGQCADIAATGTYSFANDIIGNCVINIDGVVIDGAGYTLTGNITSTDAADIFIQNIIVAGNIISSNGSSTDADKKAGGHISISTSTVSNVTSGNGAVNLATALGGSITINNSTSGIITSGNGADINFASVAGNGGAITIINSTYTSIVSGNGGNSTSYIDGTGGLISISGSTLNLANKTITAGNPGLPYNGYLRYSGTLTLSYTSAITTNTSTVFNNVSGLFVNGISYGPWNTVFNPSKKYFNATVSADGNWSNANNWWLDIGAVNPAGSTPSSADDVEITTNITQITSGTASVSSILFSASSTNAINISVVTGATFLTAGQNNGTITGYAIFKENLSENSGTVTGSIFRTFTSDATTTRNFTSDGGRSNWIVTADGAVVDISGATYSATNNAFRAINGGSFIYGSNPAGQVVPDVEIISPATSSTVTKWSPNIDWDNSTVCSYSYNNFATASSSSCGSNGSDIARPTSSGAHTLYVRGGNSTGSYTQKSSSFTYDNTAPAPTACGLDLLDEATRPYYYLEGNVTGTCYVRVNTELRGASSSAVTGFTVNGSVSADFVYGNGYNISLKNITVTGAVSSNGGFGYGGVGAQGEIGNNGGNITIATSTTGAIISNGGSARTTGGNGGTITVTNSSGVASSTTITANGGNATVCGFGGSGGTVTLNSSSYGTVTTNSGNDQTVLGIGLCSATPGGRSGIPGAINSVGQYSGNPQQGVQTGGEDETSDGSASNSTEQTRPGSSESARIERINDLTQNGQETVVNSNSQSSSGSGILNSIGITRKNIDNAIQKTKTVVGSPTSQAVEAVGVTVGLLSAASFYVGGLFTTPLLASELFLIPMRLWGLLLMAFGLKKRIPPWGTVYDSVTKRPIDPAYVTVTDESGKVVAESITDIDGRYGFFLPDGKYRISAQKTNYEFPSKKLGQQASDEMYQQLYHGEEIVVKAGEVIDKNIPLDPVGFDWNEYAKNEQNATLFHKKHEKNWRMLGDVIFKVGLILAVVSTVFHPSTYNIIILSTYLLVFLFSFFGIKGRQFGFIVDRMNNRPLAYAIFRVLSLDHQTVFRSGVCDDKGRYYCIVPKGQYYLDIEKKNPDGSYTKVYESDILSGDRGIINKSFAV
jgi:hypothetical protein